MDDTNKTCREFVAALASSAPTPPAAAEPPPSAGRWVRLSAAWWRT